MSRYAPSRSTARAVRARARNLSSRNDGSSAQCRSSRTTSTGRNPDPAARHPRHRDTASNKRNWASAAAAAFIGSAVAALAGPAARGPDCSSQPASPSSAAGRPLARSTCDQGQYGGAPSPSQQNPRRTSGACRHRPDLADQRGQHRRLADAGLAADHQELPGAAAGVVGYRTGGCQCGLPADEPADSTHGFIMAGQGRSSNTRFIGAGTSSLRTRPNPAPAATARSRC